MPKLETTEKRRLDRCKRTKDAKLRVVRLVTLLVAAVNAHRSPREIAAIKRDILESYGLFLDELTAWQRLEETMLAVSGSALPHAA